MRLIILGHRQNRDHCDRALGAHFTACALVHRCKVGIKVAGITATTGYLFTCGGNLTKCLGIVGNIGDDNQHVHIALECEILCGSECHTRRRNTLDCSIRCQVDKEHGAVDSACALEVGNEEIGFLKGDTHSCKNNCEFIIGIANLCLTGNLCREVCMRQTRTRENGQLLSANKGIQTVNSRNTGLNELGRIVTCGRIDRCAVDVKCFFGNQTCTAVDGFTHTVEYATKHILRYGELYAVTCEANFTVGKVDACGGFKQLNKYVSAVYFEYTTAANLAIRQFNFTKLIVLNALDLLDKHKRTCNFFDGSVFSNHCPALLYSASTPAISLSICAAISALIALNSF